MTLKIVKLGKIGLPKLPYRKAALRVLGRSYELDLIFASSAFMKNLNKTYRRKNKSTNVLAFGLSETKGEIVFDSELIKREARKYGQTFKKQLWRLFLHGIFHLKGYKHGSRMDAAEAKILKSFPF